MQIPCLLIYFVFEAAPDRYCSTPGAMAMSSLDPYMQGGAASRGVGAFGDDALSTPESSLLLVHLDRAIKCERASALDRIQRDRLELQRAQALLQAETQRVASARAASRVSDERVEVSAARAAAAERRADAAESALKGERKAWLRERAELVARAEAEASRSVPPATLLDRLFEETERRPSPPEDELRAWADRARAYVQLLESVQRAIAPSPRPVASPRASAAPSPRVSAATRILPAAAPSEPVYAAPVSTGDEMERLLLKYEVAKAKLQALENVYPNS